MESEPVDLTIEVACKALIQQIVEDFLSGDPYLRSYWEREQPRLLQMIREGSGFRH